MKRKYQKKTDKSSSSAARDEDVIHVPLDRTEVQRLLSEGLRSSLPLRCPAR